jgi:hypothetical protein
MQLCGKIQKTNYNLGYNTEIKEDDRANTVIFNTFYILMLVIVCNSQSPKRTSSPK